MGLKQIYQYLFQPIYINRRLSSIKHNGFDYGFTYDGMGRTKDVKIADLTHSSNEYQISDTTTVTTTYAT